MARAPIPKDVATEVLFASNRTCCVCRIPGKRLQLHHVDGDASNSVLENVAALCFDCHDQTQISGGFGRQLDATLVERHRSDWHLRVRQRRDAADRLATTAMASAPSNRPAAVRPNVPAEDYVMQLPSIRAKAYAQAKPHWDSGKTWVVVEATYAVIAVLEEVMATLCMYYADGHFDVPNPRDYVSELIAGRFSWHFYRHQPDGQGKNGSIFNTQVARSVLWDVERMTEELVSSLMVDWSGETRVYQAWKVEWERLDNIDAQGCWIRTPWEA